VFDISNLDWNWRNVLGGGAGGSSSSSGLLHGGSETRTKYVWLPAYLLIVTETVGICRTTPIDTCSNGATCPHITNQLLQNGNPI